MKRYIFGVCLASLSLVWCVGVLADPQETEQSVDDPSHKGVVTIQQLPKPSLPAEPVEDVAAAAPRDAQVKASTQSSADEDQKEEDGLADLRIEVELDERESSQIQEQIDEGDEYIQIGNTHVQREVADRWVEAAMASPAMRSNYERKYPGFKSYYETAVEKVRKAEAQEKLKAAERLAKQIQDQEKAEKLIGQMATADQSRLDAIERELASLGSPAVLALEMAALSGDFEIRQKARTLADRVRWRATATQNLMTKQPKLVEIMSADNEKHRASLVDLVCEKPSPDNLPFLIECVADWQPYVRQRSIDGLVMIGSQDASSRRKVSVVLHDMLEVQDRKSAVLIVNALGKMQTANPRKLAPLLQSTDNELKRTALLAMGYSHFHSRRCGFQTLASYAAEHPGIRR